MRASSRIGLVALLPLALGAACSSGTPKQPAAEARVVAVGLPGAGAITSVGKFLPGRPINDNAAFKASTEPGRILDPNRILVGSASNFGAPMAVPDDMPGSILSIDPTAPDVLTVPAQFAAGGGRPAPWTGRSSSTAGRRRPS